MKQTINFRFLFSIGLSIAIFITILKVDKWVAVEAKTVYSVSDIPSEHVVKTPTPVPAKPSISPVVIGPVVVPVAVPVVIKPVKVKRVAVAYRTSYANGACGYSYRSACASGSCGSRKSKRFFSFLRS